MHDDFIALGTEDSLGERRAAPVVDQHGGRLTVGKPTIAPLHERDEGRGEVLALLGENVLVANRTILVGNPLENTGPDQLAEAIGEQVLGDAQILLELAEPSNAAKSIAAGLAASNGPR